VNTRRPGAVAGCSSPSMRACPAACSGVIPRVHNRQAVSASSSTRVAGRGCGRRCSLLRSGPIPAAGSGHGHLEGGSFGGGHVAQRVRQRPHERIEDGSEVVRADQPGPPDGLADLLVVGPVLGEVPGGVQPRGRRSGTGPAHRLPEGAQVNRLPELRDLVPGDGEQVDEQRQADATGGGHQSPLNRSRKEGSASPSRWDGRGRSGPDLPARAVADLPEPVRPGGGSHRRRRGTASSQTKSA
jgi:hypothetical protein